MQQNQGEPLRMVRTRLAHKGRQSGVPFLFLQGRALGVEGRLGLARRVADDLHDLAKGLPARRVVPGPVLQSAQPVEQRGHPALFPRPAARETAPSNAFTVRRSSSPRMEQAVPRTHLAPRPCRPGREVVCTCSRRMRTVFGVGEVQTDQNMAARPPASPARPVRLDRDGVRLHHRRLDPAQLLEEIVELSAECGQGLAHPRRTPSPARRAGCRRPSKKRPWANSSSVSTSRRKK